VRVALALLIERNWHVAASGEKRDGEHKNSKPCHGNPRAGFAELRDFTYPATPRSTPKVCYFMLFHYSICGIEKDHIGDRAMTIALCFWILMLIWLVFGLLVWSGNVIGPYGGLGNTILLFVLFLLLGWHVFGAPLHG
jgi:hypothetical protein